MTGVQQALDFSHAVLDHAAPVVPSPDRDRVRGQCLRLLERLERGPTTNTEMIEVMRIYNHTARISDLRALGYKLDCTPLHAGVNEYRLVK